MDKNMKTPPSLQKVAKTILTDLSKTIIRKKEDKNRTIMWTQIYGSTTKNFFVVEKFLTTK